MKKLLLLLTLLPAAAWSQTSRLATLQNARNLAITDGRHTAYKLIRGGETQVLHRRNGKLIAGRDTFDTRTTTFRLKSMTRFAADEDSTQYGGDYAVDHGLLAFRRSLNVGRWNSLVVPFSLTGAQLRDAFGDDARLAMLSTVTDGPQPTLEFQSVSLDTDSVVLKAGNHYLINPTREADVPEGGLTSVAYGGAKVAGPVYAIANVTLEAGQVARYQTLRSESKEVRVRVRGYYSSHDVNVASSTRYLMDDDGLFYQLSEATVQKGFRSVVEDSSPGERQPLRFYIDGVDEDLTSAVGGLAVTGSAGEPSAVYDLRGRRVAHPSKGLYIVGGKKVIIR